MEEKKQKMKNLAGMSETLFEYIEGCSPARRKHYLKNNIYKLINELLKTGLLKYEK